MKLVDYIRDTRAEMHHVVWPTRRQAIAYSVAVIAISAAGAALFGGLDILFSYIIRYIVVLR